MKKLFKKACLRVLRLIIYRKSVFGQVGKKNRFTKGVFISEDAKIGSYNYFGPYSMVNNASIGNYCSIAPSVKIGQGEHSLHFVTTYQKISKKVINYSLNTSPAVIGNDVWCGANVVIKQGVTVGTGAVIGANSVVTKNIPEYAICVGAPAKVIKFRFSQEEIDKIKNTNWYDYDIDEAINIVNELEKKR
ncbi:CatB-related O-acetyltransferase [Priestia aryabhattai]|uniref:CatB-related O-acetyltransferase n=1 Tax=Priestia aryabhattai TaxID=412384 RepID=UPI0027E30F6B|nr:CatB-related O-acetyltransferase [Priestia aryabhattai]